VEKPAKSQIKASKKLVKVRGGVSGVRGVVRGGVRGRVVRVRGKGAKLDGKP